MSCSSCTKGTDGKPGGCRSNGNCGTSGCNKLNTFDWLAQMEIFDSAAYNVVEVSFKNGARKSFYENPIHARAIIGDMVVVEANGGYDVGCISLTGELVRMQMKKKNLTEDHVLFKIIRKANERDLEKLGAIRDEENQVMVRGRAIARTMDLKLKLGDVEFQGDRRKATFYYTADGRIDFRELIRHYAKEFRVKIEMRQIGARQESARIGGLGSCGRELCCSTWLSDFKSVSTAAARYQNLAINQSKLSGQCGRLKCCLNYELDVYLDALDDFPRNAEKIKTRRAEASLIKTDVFKRLMYYVYPREVGKGKVYRLSVERVKEIQSLNKKGEFPDDLVSIHEMIDLDDDNDFQDVTGAIELPPEERRQGRSRNRRKSNRDRSRRDNRKNNNPKKTDSNKESTEKTATRNQPSDNRQKNRRPSNRRQNPGRNKSQNKDKAASDRNMTASNEKRDSSSTNEKDNKNRNNRSRSNRSRNYRSNKPKRENKPPEKKD